jgi:hypothetical protein
MLKVSIDMVNSSLHMIHKFSIYMVKVLLVIDNATQM